MTEIPDSIYTTVVDPQRVAVIGAATGMGAAIVKVLRERGVRVAALDWNSKVLESEAEFSAIVDISDFYAVSAALDASAEALGGLEGLVPVAGIVHKGTVDDTSPEDWERMFAVNARGVFNVAKAGIPHLRKAGGGAFVAVTSQVGLVGAPKLSAYCSAKAAAIEFIRCLAVDHSHEGIRVNTVCPGITGWTGTFEDYLKQFEGEELEAEMTRQKATNLQNRLIEPREIAEAVSFLVSAKSPAILGTTLVVDGGYTAQ